MAKYTVELSSIICSYAGLISPDDDPQSVTIKGISYNGKTVPDFTYNTHHFEYDGLLTPNQIINSYAFNCFQRNAGDLIDNFTNDQQINTQIMTQLINTFCRHFWGYEIGQEDPLYWWTLVRGFFDENMPLFIQEYQEMIINKQNFITGLTKTTTNNTGELNSDVVGTTDGASNSLNGTADTPQNQLNFSLNSADPTKDYTFNYASNVAGAKSTNFNKANTTTNQNTKNNTTSQSFGRNQTIMSLVNQLNQFSNGMYLELFNKAKQYGLFMNVF